MKTTASFSLRLLAPLLLVLSQPAMAEIKLRQNADAQLKSSASAALGIREGDLGLAAGSTVPNAKLQSFTGERVELAQMWADQPALVVFYRGGWCPYCNVQIRQLANAFPKFLTRNVTPVLISVDKADASTLVANAYEIPFPVLSDPKLKAHKAFNVLLPLDDKAVKRYEGFGINLEQWSGEKHHTIAAASVFLVDTDGKVRWAHVEKDFKSRPSTKQLLDMIDNAAL